MPRRCRTSPATPIFLAQRSLEATAGLAPLTADDLVILEHGVKLFDLPDLSTPDGFNFANPNTITSYIYGGTNSGTCMGGPATCMKEANYLTQGGLSLRPADAKRNAVTAALQAASVTNDFLTGTAYDSDWVFTFPGKYMFREVPAVLGGNYFFDNDGPFTVPVTRSTGQACEAVEINGPVGIRDREEAKTSQDDVGFSPGIAETFNLCYEVNVVSINDDGGGSYSGALSSSAVWQQASGWPTYGFAQLGFNQAMVDDNGVTHWGMPFIGFAAITDRATDVTRGGTFMHKVVRGLRRNQGLSKGRFGAACATSVETETLGSPFFFGACPITGGTTGSKRPLAQVWCHNGCPLFDFLTEKIHAQNGAS